MNFYEGENEGLNLILNIELSSSHDAILEAIEFNKETIELKIGNAIAQAFPLRINRNESIGQLKKFIKAKKVPEFSFCDADRLRLWKVQVRVDNDKELNELTLHDKDQLLTWSTISSYFTDKPLDKHIHIVVKPSNLIHFSLELALKAGLFNGGGRISRQRLYLSKTPPPAVCEGRHRGHTVFWGRSLKEDDKTWRVYVVSRNISYLRKRTENVMEDQMIRFITEEEGFANSEIRRQSPHDPLPTLKKIPKSLQKAFDEALDIELGPSFREMHYNLVGMSTGYKRTQGKFTEIRGYPVDIVEACAATPYGFGVSACQAYQTPLIQEVNKKRQQCYLTVWFDRQLVFEFNMETLNPETREQVLWTKKGILHAAWITENFRYAIASPYFAVFEALNVEPQL
ncbi:hypothetical protein C1645_870752 [Glomus cerebriforme]|uniref:Crinkler effector protein N-terminal domain-containing protein n=1 Tax=Glomus cerebriforme TaxID=658196 RepID=A0A397TNA5_9GLOM|nr:hypothetical protein C1645_870752 [Glomus cerebriforme]